MVEKTESNVKPDSHESGASFYNMARKMMLAAIGAAVVAQDEIEQFLSRMVEKGEIAEKDARSLMKEMIEKREKMLKERRAEREKSQTSKITKEDLDVLNARLVELTRQVEELKKQKKS